MATGLKRARNAAIALVKSSREVEPSLGIRLLADLRTIFGDDDALTSKVILAKLIAIEEAPWGDLKGKPLSERGLAQRLRQYDVRPKVIRIGDTTPRGYTAADLHDAWKRYLPLSSSANNATRETSATAASKPIVPFQRDVADVSHVTHFVGDERRVCAQCRAGDEDGRPDTDLQCDEENGGQRLWLHPECRRFYRAAAR